MEQIAVIDNQVNGKLGILDTLSDHEKRICSLEVWMIEANTILKTIKGVLVYIACFLTASVGGLILGLLWAILTHQVTLTF